MARPKSVILSKEEKKQVVSNLKGEIKVRKGELKVALAGRKTTEKQFAAAIKTNDKSVAVLTKAIAAAEAQLAALLA